MCLPLHEATWPHSCQLKYVLGQGLFIRVSVDHIIFSRLISCNFHQIDSGAFLGKSFIVMWICLHLKV